MNWVEHHKYSEHLASAAEVAFNKGRKDDAIDLYRKAAGAETKALSIIDDNKPRTIGITAVSAASLWYKAGDIKMSQQIALNWLLAEAVPSFAIDQLRHILQTIWSDIARSSADIKFLPGEVFVAVKGGEVVHGGAPLDLITKKVEGIQSLFYRTVELMLSKPLRKRGGPEKEIQQICRPWLLQAAPSSYQFAVAIQETPQLKLFEEQRIKGSDVAKTFFDIVKASVESPDDALANIVPDEEYRETILKITRNLAPTGKIFEEMVIKSSATAKPVRLVPAVRKSITKSIKRIRTKDEETEPVIEVIRGTLRGVHLDKDWLELTVKGETLHVDGVGETVDDVIGPMVNRDVIVEVKRDAKGKLTLRDIESED